MTWAELRRARKAGRIDRLIFSPVEALKRVKKLGDLFAPVLEKKQQLPRQFVQDVAIQSRRAVPRPLERYTAKRHFTKAREPLPALPTRSAQGSRRRFVIQYFTFEGTVPEGEYGGRTVMVWDVGTFDIIDGSYRKGDLRLWLSGNSSRANGRFFGLSRRGISRSD